MSSGRTVGELREDASRVLAAVDLNSVFLVSTEHASRPRSGDGTLQVIWGVQVTANHSDTAIEVQVRYSAWAVESERIEGPPEDVPEELLEELHVWKSQSEWIASYVVGDDGDISGLTEDQVAAFGIIMGPPHVHPYEREHLQSLTAKGPYAAFTLELMRPLGAMPDDTEVEYATDVSE